MVKKIKIIIGALLAAPFLFSITSCVDRRSITLKNVQNINYSNLYKNHDTKNKVPKYYIKSLLTTNTNNIIPCKNVFLVPKGEIGDEFITQLFKGDNLVDIPLTWVELNIGINKNFYNNLYGGKCTKNGDAVIKNIPQGKYYLISYFDFNVVLLNRRETWTRKISFLSTGIFIILPFIPLLPAESAGLISAVIPTTIKELNLYLTYKITDSLFEDSKYYLSSKIFTKKKRSINTFNVMVTDYTVDWLFNLDEDDTYIWEVGVYSLKEIEVNNKNNFTFSLVWDFSYHIGVDTAVWYYITY